MQGLDELVLLESDGVLGKYLCTKTNEIVEGVGTIAVPGGDKIEKDRGMVIWYLFEVTDGVKQVFLNDFIIKEEERRKGYASAALIEMEWEAQRNGCTESINYVWKHNLPGINLYAKCGYVTFRELDDGMYMKKVLKG